MLIRRLGENDLEALWALRLQALTDTPEVFGSTYEETTNRGKASFLSRLQARDDIFYLGAFDPDLVGMVAFARESGTKEWHKGHLISMYVLPERRGQGVGKALVQDLIVHARQLEGLEQLLLTVVTTAREAANLYRSLGFQSYGTAQRALKADDQYWDEDLMMLSLS